jgi:replication factor C small subunit
MSKYNSLWVEKYRPSTLNDIILTDDVRNFFETITSETPHIFLWGRAGTGKTSLAKLIVNDILKCQYLYINASDENGVDTIRNKVISFAQTKSFDGNIKIIILDEADGLTKEGQRILRNVMEEYSSNVRFILTANYYNEIIEPIESRCLIFNLKPTLNSSIERCLNILKTENVNVPENIRDILKDFIENRNYDLRRVINDLQKFSIDGNFQLIVTNNVTTQIAQNILKSLIKKESVLDIRNYIISQEVMFESNYQKLLKEIFDVIYNLKLSEQNKKELLLEIGEYMYRDNMVLDHEINFFCCILSLEKVLN